MKEHITIKINKKAIKEKEFIKYLGVFTIYWYYVQIETLLKCLLIYSHIIYAIEA